MHFKIRGIENVLDRSNFQKTSQYFDDSNYKALQMYQIEHASSLYWTNTGHPTNQILSKKHKTIFQVRLKKPVARPVKFLILALN